MGGGAFVVSAISVAIVVTIRIHEIGGVKDYTEDAGIDLSEHVASAAQSGFVGAAGTDDEQKQDLN